MSKNSEPMVKPLRKLETNVDTLRDLDEVLKKEKCIMLVFYATWCKPCRIYENIIDGCKTEHDVPLCHVDVDKARELTQKFSVMSVPFTLIVDADMSVKKELPGVVKEDVLHMLVNECFSGVCEGPSQ